MLATSQLQPLPRKRDFDLASAAGPNARRELQRGWELPIRFRELCG